MLRLLSPYHLAWRILRTLVAVARRVVVMTCKALWRAGRCPRDLAGAAIAQRPLGDRENPRPFLERARGRWRQ
jgi:hypothetical protein